ncbi:MAG: sigma-70 family RNA polymerase sigma factor [Candidatus Riflebacteria bacterium]|nr:sigma-70 family RNA polymerase sigma factor [Candidatus Riflebacteria bacterium]
MSSSSIFEKVLDSELISLVKKGDSKALDKLLELYIPQLTAFFRYIHVPEDSVEDLVQETFEKMINKIDTFDESKKFSTWLMTIGRNLYFDQYRRKNKGNEIIATEYIENNNSIDPERETIVKLSVEELLKNLSDKERFLLEMRIFQKMPFNEIAEITGESDTSLRSRFFRAINRLKSIV